MGKKKTSLERGSQWLYHDASRPEIPYQHLELAAFDRDTVRLCVPGTNRSRGYYPGWSVWRPLFEANALKIRAADGYIIPGRPGGGLAVKRFGFVKRESAAAPMPYRLHQKPVRSHKGVKIRAAR